MAVIKFALVFLEILTCILLLAVILIQRSKSQGVGMSFGGGAGEAIFGAQMGNVLTRATVILGIIFLVNTLALSILLPRGGSNLASKFKAPPPAPVTTPGQVLPDSGSLDDLSSEPINLEGLEGTATGGETTESGPSTVAPIDLDIPLEVPAE